MRQEGFDELSLALRYLRANGVEKPTAVNTCNGPKAEAHVISREPRETGRDD